MGWLTANEPLSRLPRTWYAEGARPYDPAPPLGAALRTEVCVVGGGITGCAAALTLAQAGRAVVLLEAAQAGWGASGRNGGQVSSGLNWDPRRIAARFGLAEARALWDLTERAKALTRGWIAAHAPEADDQTGILYGVRAGVQALRAEADWAAEHLEYQGFEALDAAACAARIGSARFTGGLLDRGGSFCNPLAYVRGLARAARAAGAAMFEGTPVLRLTPGRPMRLETPEGAVTADQVIWATNGYHDGRAPGLAGRVLPINNLIACTEPLGARAPMPAPLAVADDRYVVNYWHQTRDGRLVYGGGETYGRRFPRDIAGVVRRHLARSYPDLAEVRLTHAWGGTLAVTANRLPFVASVGPGVLAAGGYSGLGLALSGLTGQAMARKILGEGGDFERLRRLPVPRLPGGRWFGPSLAAVGMGAQALRDRLRP